MAESDFEVLPCPDVNSLAEFTGAKPPVILVDLAILSDAHKSKLIKHMGRVNAPLAVALSDSADADTCEQLLRSGFVGLVGRSEPPETLGRMLSAVEAGELWFPRETISRLLKEFLVPNVNRLTARESEILTLIGRGLNNQQIGNTLFIARETVRWHLRGLYSKLGLDSRRGAKEYVRLISAVNGAKSESHSKDIKGAISAS
jgi:DNA-binding NarL/FixJ family response regulator